MLWAVDTGGGYPYPNGTDVAKYVSPTDFKLMDTDGNGMISMDDDPYAPYYPVSIPNTGKADSVKQAGFDCKHPSSLTPANTYCSLNTMTSR